MNGEANHGEPAGPIAYMASNRVAATLLMLGILAAGLVSLGGLEREAWPVVPFNTIEVSMAYPGATPHEIEESIVAKIEEELRPLEDVKAVKSVAAPGMASIRAELKTDTDIGPALEDIKSAVARIQSFPGAAERAEFREMSNRQSMIRLIVHGDISERALKELASQIEEELATLPNVSYVETTGTRRYEISVEVPLVRLRALGLTLADVAQAVRGASLDLSAGSIDTRESQVRVRTLGQRYDQQDFEDIVLVARTDGTVIRLGDVATVHDAFEDVDLILRHQGNPAVFVEVSRADGEQVMDVAGAVHEHIANVVVPSLPDGVGVTIWNDDSQTYSERLNLLLKNGLLGLALVMVALALFLEIRLAVWVVVGLLTAGIGALAVMMVFDIAINTISLFAFVLAIGIIVDDAIVVAEHIHQERMRGTDSVVAAIRGTRRIRGPLTFAVLTSVAAFVPLLYIPGGIGEVWTALPVILIGMLLISLVESLFILPKHLAHLPGPDWTPTGVVDRFFARTQGGVERALRRFIDGPLDRALWFSTEQPAVILASVIGFFFFTVSLLPAGVVPTTFADVVEGDFVSATIEMPDGTTAERTHEVALSLEEIGQRVLDRLSAEQGQELVTGVMISVGQGPRVEGGGLNPAPRLNPQANIATVEFKLVSAQERDISTIAVMQAWRDEVGVVPYARGVAFSGEVIDLGAPVEAVLSHPDPDRLGEIADVVVEGLRSVAGVFDVRSDHAPGVRELQLSLLPDARTLGFTVAGLARQVRSAFFGTEALRLQRGAEEVRVYVRLPEDERDAIADIEALIVQAPSGERVPLTHVAALSMGTSPPTIRRKDGQRVVTVTARRGRQRDHRRRGQCSARGQHPRRTHGLQSGTHLLIRRRAATAARVPRLALSGLHARHAGDFRLARDCACLLRASIHRHGDRAVRIDRRDPWAPGAWRRAERGVLPWLLWPERRGGQRLPRDDRLHRRAPEGWRFALRSDRRGCKGSLSPHSAHLADDLPGLHSPHPRTRHPSPVSSSFRRLLGCRHPRHDGPPHGADPGPDVDLSALEGPNRTGSGLTAMHLAVGGCARICGTVTREAKVGQIRDFTAICDPHDLDVLRTEG